MVRMFQRIERKLRASSLLARLRGSSARGSGVLKAVEGGGRGRHYVYVCDRRVRWSM